MMVPRSFRYSSSPPTKTSHESPYSRHNRESSTQTITIEKRSITPVVRVEAVAHPIKTATKPVAVPKPHDRSRSRDTVQIATPERQNRRSQQRPLTSKSHDPHALPPAVAALLAVTAIPPRRASNSLRQKFSYARRISIDELVCEWKNEELLGPTYGSSPQLSALLEVSGSEDAQFLSSSEGDVSFLRTRSTSSDSMPSLSDAHSLASVRSPSTPGSLRSHHSLSSFKKDRVRSLTMIESCPANHPLSASVNVVDDDPSDGLFLANSTTRTTPSKSSFRSNLTSSLHALKNAALSSISSLARTPTTGAAAVAASAVKSKNVAPFSDDMLWSHPYLFPQFSSEVRPQVSNSATEAQRRYLNPVPLTFEEQEAPFQRALHAPFLAEQNQEDDAMTEIPMQTYHRPGSKRRSRSSSAGSEAGRALLGAAGVRHRETRENSNFLRVVVLEMNMRRQGKIEGGRAQMCLPPRENSRIYQAVSIGNGRSRRNNVPVRWQGVSAY